MPCTRSCGGRYPIDGTAELAIAVREAGSQFASQQMLAQALLAWPAPRYPIGGTAKPVIASPHPIDGAQEPVIAARAAGSRFASQQMLSRSLRTSDTPPEVHLPESKCSPVFIIPVMGYGAEPHDYSSPLTLNLEPCPRDYPLPLALLLLPSQESRTTAPSTSAMPATAGSVSGSPKNSRPSNMATTGSTEAKIAALLAEIPVSP